MSTDNPLQPQIEQSLQRFDIADFDALTEWTKKYLNEHMKDLLLAALGRVFYGFKIVAGSGALDIKISGEALAVNAAGELLVRKSTDGDSTLTLAGVAGNYYVSMILQTPSTSTANRKKWDTGAEVTINVNTMRRHVADFISPPPTASGLDMANFAATYVDGDGVQRVTLPLAIVVNNGTSITAIHDCRRMFAVDGNINGSVTGLGTELPHDFAPTDAKTLGITSLRAHLVALADRIKTITGKSLWQTDPDATIASLLRTGVKSVSYSDVASITDHVNGDIVYATGTNALAGFYRFVESGGLTAVAGQVITATSGSPAGQWWRVDDALFNAILGSKYGVEAFKTTGVYTPDVPTRVRELSPFDFKCFNQSSQALLTDTYQYTTALDAFLKGSATGGTIDAIASVDLPPGAKVSKITVVYYNASGAVRQIVLRARKVVNTLGGGTGVTTSMFSGSSVTNSALANASVLAEWSETCDGSAGNRTLAEIYGEDVGTTDPTTLHVMLSYDNATNFRIHGVRVHYYASRVRN